MPENIAITFMGTGPGQTVEVEYEPATPEAEGIDAAAHTFREIRSNANPWRGEE